MIGLGRGTGDFRIPERFGMRSSFSSNPANNIAWSLNLEASQEDLGPKIINPWSWDCLASK